MPPIPLSPRNHLDDLKVLGLSCFVVRISDDLAPLIGQADHIEAPEIRVCGIVVSEENSMRSNGFQPHPALDVPVDENAWPCLAVKHRGSFRQHAKDREITWSKVTHANSDGMCGNKADRWRGRGSGGR